MEKKQEVSQLREKDKPDPIEQILDRVYRFPGVTEASRSRYGGDPGPGRHRKRP